MTENPLLITSHLLHPCFSLISNHCSFAWCVAHYGFSGSSDDKESACNVGDQDSIRGSGRYSEEGNGNPLVYSCLGNPMDRGSWLICMVLLHEKKNSSYRSYYLMFILEFYTDALFSQRDADLT